MNIAFEINFHKKSDSLIQEFNLDLFAHFSKQYPDCNFFLISNIGNYKDKCSLPNQIFIKSPSGFLKFITCFLWRFFILKLKIKKHKIDSIVSDGIYDLKHNSDINQYHWLNELRDLSKIKNLSKNNFLLCVNRFLISKIEEKNKSLKSQLLEVLPVIDYLNFNKTFETKRLIKEKFSDNREYFLYSVDSFSSQDEIITKIKAFSHFKKWQKSNMLFILLIQNENEVQIQKLIESYKYKEDVKIVIEENNTASNELLSAAYGCILSNKSIAVNDKMLAAIQLNVPMILEENDYYKSSFGEACVYSEMNDIKLSQKMILLYKDEAYREQIINETIIYKQKHNWKDISNQIWRTLSEQDKY